MAAPRTARLPLPQPADSLSLEAFMARYARWLAERNYSPRTVDDRSRTLGHFLTWCEDRGLMRPTEITRPILERYQRQLFLTRKADGAPLAYVTQYSRLDAIRCFFRWLTKANHILSNPAADLEMPRLPKRMPRAVLTPAEAEAVLAGPEVGTPLGLRDRAILETFYSTGIRRSELARLVVTDLDVERGTLLVKEGKGAKDRMVPIGERAVAWVLRYLDDGRPFLAIEPDEGVLFLSIHGKGLVPESLSGLVHRWVERAGIGKSGSCHMFRHTCATAMLEGGADIRYIQSMLGHEELSSTEVYTRVSIRRLKAIHAATHPAAKLEPRHVAGQVLAELENDQGAAEVPEKPLDPDLLLSSLDLEAEEEDPVRPR